MSDDGIDIKIRSYANLITHGPSVSIPATPDGLAEVYREQLGLRTWEEQAAWLSHDCTSSLPLE